MTLIKFHMLAGAGAIALTCAGFVAPGMAQQQAPANQQAAPAQSSQPGQYGTMQQAPNSPADSNAPKVNPYTGETGIPSDTPEPSHPSGRDKLNGSTTYPAGEPTPNQSQNPHR